MAVTKHQERNAVHADYRSWLALLPCCICGEHVVQLAHVGAGGMGLKHGDDDQCIPLCYPCHCDHDETKGRFERPFFIDKQTWRMLIARWDETQVAAHRGRFEARNVPDGEIPF